MITKQWYSKTFMNKSSKFGLQQSYKVQANRAGDDESSELLYDSVTILQTEKGLNKNMFSISNYIERRHGYKPATHNVLTLPLTH